MRDQRRFLRIVLPRIQLRLILAFGALAALALLLQHLLFLRVVSGLLSTLPDDGGTLISDVQVLLWRSMAIAAGVLLPVTLLVAVLVTRRWCGPLYRMQTFLREIVGGKNPQDCRLRTGDELIEFCALLNQATRPARGAARESAETTDIGRSERTAA
jgi:polyferredoxin